MTSKSRRLNTTEIAALAEELDALRARTVADLGDADARYIRRIYKAVRYTEIVGRGLLFIGIFPPAFVLGTLLLAVSKILDNMELGHNVMHGQYDWMRDPKLNGKTFEWDIVATGDNWRKSHNYRHHNYTNIKGLDEDVGYGILRLFPEQRWKPAYLLQPFYSILFALLFQWGVAIQELRLGLWFKGRVSRKKMAADFAPVGRKMRRQLIKDYVIFPLLAGPFFLPVMLGNVIANGMRNVWTFMVIFCGHFTADVEVFPRSILKNETRGHWYVRQLRGSSNLSGGKLLHLMTGNLSHQIEHHLFPDIPARRYAGLAVEVRDICKRYGQNYNTGPMAVQFAQVIWRIVRFAFPGGKPAFNVRRTVTES